MRTRLAAFAATPLALLMLAGCYRDGRWYWSQQQADRGYNYSRSNNYNSNRTYESGRGTTTVGATSSSARGGSSSTMGAGVSAGGSSASGMAGTSSSMSDDMWAHSRMTGMNESDLPSSVRSSMQRHAGNGQLTQVGRTTWNAQTYYAAQATMNGQQYRIVTDANGNLVMMKRVSMMGSGMSGQNSGTSGSRAGTGMGSGTNDRDANDRDTGGGNTSNTNPQDRPGVPPR